MLTLKSNLLFKNEIIIITNALYWKYMWNNAKIYMCNINIYVIWNINIYMLKYMWNNAVLSMSSYVLNTYIL